MININSKLQQRKDEITKDVKENNDRKEEIKIMNKEEIQRKQKEPQKERTIKTSLKTLRKLRESWKNKIKY